MCLHTSPATLKLVYALAKVQSYCGPATRTPIVDPASLTSPWAAKCVCSFAVPGVYDAVVLRALFASEEV